MQMPVNTELDKNAWVPVVEIEDTGPELRTFGTQTDGLFYPSSRTISKQKGVELSKMILQTSARDRVPKLHSYSPGRGMRVFAISPACTHAYTNSYIGRKSSSKFS